MIGSDPELTDPAHGDYAPAPGSPAGGYGCQTFPVPAARSAAADWIRAGATRGGNATAVPTGRDDSYALAAARPQPAPLIPLIAPRRERSSATVAGTIASDTIWDADTIYVAGDVTIAPGVRLTVVPGTLVLADGYHGVTVRGALRAIGTVEAPIVWRSRHAELFAVDTTLAGSWRGIDFPFTSALQESSRFAYCHFENGKSFDPAAPGGVFAVAGFSKLRLSNCHFRANVADYGAALFCANFAAPRLIGCLFHDNHAFLSGAVVYAADAHPRLTNCTVVGNPIETDEIFDPRAAVHNFIAKTRLVNTILRENATPYFLGGQVYGGRAFYTRYCNIEGGYGGEGVIDADPLFRDQPPHAFALGDESPCIDAGTPDTSGLSLPAHDLAGALRVQNGRVDIGAYEGGGASTVAGLPAGREQPTLRLTPCPLLPGVHGAQLHLSLPRAGRVRIDLFDVAGRRLATPLEETDLAAGRHALPWPSAGERGQRLPRGLYFLRLQAPAGEAAVRFLQLD